MLSLLIDLAIVPSKTAESLGRKHKFKSLVGSPAGKKMLYGTNVSPKSYSPVVPLSLSKTTLRSDANESETELPVSNGL
jgi:hypothetical protein